MKSTKLKTTLRASISLMLLGIIVWNIEEIDKIWDLLQNMNIMFILVILFVSTFDRALMTYKWELLLRSRGQILSFFYGMKIYCASMIWGTVLPATIGADAFRAYSTHKGGVDLNEAITSILVERVIGFLSSCVLGLCSLVLLFHLVEFNKMFSFIGLVSVLFFLSLIAMIIALINKSVFEFLYTKALKRFKESKIVNRLKQIHNTFIDYKKNKQVLLFFFSLTFIEQTISIIYNWLIALSIGVQIDIIYMAAIIPLALSISRLPVSIDGLGVYEGTFILLMSLSDITAAQSFTIAVIGRVLQVASFVPWFIGHAVSPVYIEKSEIPKSDRLLLK